MVHTVTIPAITVTLETQEGILPDGTMIQLSVPVKGLAVKPVTLSGVEGGVEASDQLAVDENPKSDIPNPISVPTVDTLPSSVSGLPSPTLDRSYENVEFRALAKRFDTLGNAMTLGLSDADWTIVLNVRFVKFGTIQRVIGSATASTAGSSLQIGTLEDGQLWVDTFIGGLTAGKVELNRFYEIVLSHHTDSRLKIYIDKKLIAHSGIPSFHSEADIYVGRWLENVYSDFDLQRVRIYRLLSDEEVLSV